MSKLRKIPERGSRPRNFSPQELLFQAAEKNDQKSAEFLVTERRIPVNIVDYNDRTPAHIAAMYGHVNIVKFLLSKDPSILEMEDKSEETVLMKAVTYGHLPLVKYIVENSKIDITKRFSHRHFGNTIVHHATRHGQLEILKYFIEERNVDVNIENSLRETPLFFAAENKIYRIIQYLIEEGNADPTKVDSKGHNILFKALHNDDLGFIKYLIDVRQIPFDLNWRAFNGDTLVLHAVDLNRENILLYLVNEKHADVNIADEWEETPLHKAAARNNYRVCRFLVEHGADTTAENDHGHRPADLAKDERVIWFLKNYTGEFRSRRNVRPESIVSQSMEYPSAEWSQRIAGNFMRYLGSSGTWVSNSGALQLQTFLAVANIIMRTHKKTFNLPLLTPREIILKSADPVAVDAIQRLPEF